MSAETPVVTTSEFPLTAAQQRSHRLALRLLVPLMVLLVAIGVLYALFDNSKVVGPSMLPTLREGEYLLITRGWSDPSRGDVVVLTLEYDDGTSEEIVKRVVGLPGDTVGIRGDRAIVNAAAEPWAGSVVVSQEVRPVFDAVVPAGRVFVMGDNRPESSDSRYIGSLPIADVHGRVVAVWAPVNRMRLLP